MTSDRPTETGAPSERFVHPPLARHPTLQPLSREHYSGLTLARRLREAAADGSEDARVGATELLEEAWSSELEGHFADEELLVGPLVSEHDRVRLSEEHHALERRIAMARESDTAPSPAWLNELADLLEAHIRWEERELFPEAQRRGGGALDGLHAEAERIHRDRPGSRRRQDM